MEKIQKAYSGPERRTLVRHRTKSIKVLVSTKGKRVWGIISDMSSTGARITAPGLGLSKNKQIQLVIVVQLNMLKLYKLYYKNAIVTHVTNGSFGVLMGNREKP